MVQFPQMSIGPAGNPAFQAQIEAQVNFFSVLLLHTVDTLQRLNQLNMQLARQLFDTGFATGREMLAGQDPLRMAAAAMRGLQPSGERLGDYQHSLSGVMAGARSGLPASAATFARE